MVTNSNALIYTRRGCFMLRPPPHGPPLRPRKGEHTRPEALPYPAAESAGRRSLPEGVAATDPPQHVGVLAAPNGTHVGLQPSALGREQQLPLAHSHAQQVLPGARTAVGTEPCEPRASGPLERACERRRPRLVEGGDGREGAAVMREIARPLRASEMR